MDTIFGILNQVLREAISPGTAAVAIAVIGLNIHFGFTGLLNIGQSGFMLLGAYGFAISIIEGLPLPVAILIGLLSAVVFALVLGLPTLKLRGDYLAIVTIGAAEIVRFVGRLSMFEDFTGGSLGLRGSRYQKPFLDTSFLPRDSFTLMPFNYQDIADGATWVRVLGLLVAIALIVAVVLLARRVSVSDAPATHAGAALAVPGLLLVAVLLLVFGLLVADGGVWMVVLILLALATLGGLALAVRQVRTLQVSRPTQVRAGGAFVLGVLAFLALFFTFPIEFANNDAQGWWVRLVAWSLVLISLLIVGLLVRSPWGRLLRGVREDQEAMRSLGKNVFAIKMQALIIGGLFGALGGMVYVLPSTVQADAFGRSLTFFAYTALLLGGAATLFGPVLGTVIFYAGRILIKETANAYVPNSIMSQTEAEQFSFIVVGVVLMLLVIFRPQGIMGDKRELRINV
jgi:neutral amino acid transport system permease protein